MLLLAATAMAPLAAQAPAAPPPDKVPEPASPAKPGPGPEKKHKTFIHSLDKGGLNSKTGKDHSLVARGKMQFIIPDDNVIVYCTAADYSGDATGIATVTGDLRIETGDIAHDEKNDTYSTPKPENVITGAIGWIFTKEKRAVIDGDFDPKVDGKVKVVHHPKEPPAADADREQKARHEQSTLYCDRLIWWYKKGDRKGVAQAKLPNTTIRFEQPTQRGTAGKATYYNIEPEQGDSGDILDLAGGIKANDDDGESIEADAARILIDQEVSQWQGVTKVVVKVEGEEEQSAKPAAGAKPAAPKGPPPPAGGAAPPAAPPAK